jgi:hypothetical protein
LDNPVRYEDRDGDVPWNIAVGFAIGAGWETATQVMTHMSGGASLGEALNRIDIVDVLVEGGKGALMASGVGGVALKGVAEYGGEVIKASADISIADGNKNIFNGEKTTTQAGVDLAVNVVGGKAFDSTIGKATGHVENVAKSNADHANLAASYHQNPLAGGDGAQSLSDLRARRHATSDSKSAQQKPSIVQATNTLVNKPIKGTTANKTSDAAKATVSQMQAEAFARNNSYYQQQGQIND